MSKKLKFTCIDGPFAGAPIWLSEIHPHTFVFEVRGKRGQYRAINRDVRKRRVMWIPA